MGNSQSQKMFILQQSVMRVSNIKKHYPSSQHTLLQTRIPKREVGCPGLSQIGSYKVETEEQLTFL